MNLLTEDKACELLMEAFYRRNGRQIDVNDPKDEGALEAIGVMLNGMERGTLEAYFADGRVRVRSTVRN